MSNMEKDVLEILFIRHAETNYDDWVGRDPYDGQLTPNGEGDFGKSICMAVQTAFDTDCNGATVGSILGMRGGMDCIDDYWKKPVNGKVHTSIFGVGTVDIENAVERTMEHIKKTPDETFYVSSGIFCQSVSSPLS